MSNLPFLIMDYFGPMLFNIYEYVNNVKQHLACLFLLYVDKTFLVLLLLKLNVLYCNNVLVRLFGELKVNSTKCSVLFTTISFNDIVLQRFFQVRDLCIIIYSQLFISCHIVKFCEDALKMFGFASRNTKGFVNIDTLLILYHCFVRSKLEYCSLV